VGIGASALLAIPFGFVGTVWGLIAVAFVSAIGSGIGFPAALFVYSRTVDDERQAAAQGLMGATEVLFGGIAAVFAAWLYDNQGQRAVWIWIPTLMLAVLLGGALLRLLAEQHNGDRPGSR
jgi:MFS family permease